MDILWSGDDFVRFARLTRSSEASSMLTFRPGLWEQVMWKGDLHGHLQKLWAWMKTLQQRYKYRQCICIGESLLKKLLLSALQVSVCAMKSLGFVAVFPVLVLYIAQIAAQSDAQAAQALLSEYPTCAVCQNLVPCAQPLLTLRRPNASPASSQFRIASPPIPCVCVRIRSSYSRRRNAWQRIAPFEKA
jgi:hypothetical protein